MAKQKSESPKVSKKNTNQQVHQAITTQKNQIPPGAIAQQKLQSYIDNSPLTARAAQFQERADQMIGQQIQKKVLGNKELLQGKSETAIQRQGTVLQRIKDIVNEIYWEKDVPKLKGKITKFSGEDLAKIKDGSWAKTFTKMLETFTMGSETLSAKQITGICNRQEITLAHLELISRKKEAFAGVPKGTINRLFAGIVTNEQLLKTLSPEQINHLEDSNFKLLVEKGGEVLGGVLHQHSEEEIEKTVAAIKGSNQNSRKGEKRKELNTIKEGLVGQIETLDEKAFEQIVDKLSGDQALKLKNDQFKKLTEKNILSFGNRFFEQLSNEKLKLIEDKLKKVSSTQISKIVSTKNSDHSKNFQSFSSDFVAKIDPDTLENFVGNIQPAQIDTTVALNLLTIKSGKGVQFLTGDALRKLFTFESIPISEKETKSIYDLLTDEHVEVVNTEELGKAPKPLTGDSSLDKMLNSGKITKLDANGFSKLEAKHLPHIKTTNFSDIKATSLASLPENLFKALDAKLFEKLTEAQAKAITADQFKQLGANQIKAIQPKVFANLLPATIAVLHMAQLKQVTESQADQLSSDQFKALSFVQIAELNDDAYKKVQAKYIDKDQKAGGLKYKKDKSKVKGQKATGDLTKHHYDLGKVYTSRIEALIEITAFASKMNEKLANSLLKVRARYQEAAATKTLDLIYQINDKWKGYVISVKDSIYSQKGKMIEGSDIHHPSDSEYFDKYSSKRNSEKFSNQHHQALSSYEPDETHATNTADIKSKIKLGTSGREESFDAITKIAGEGARWKAVRNQAAKGELSNLTKFFTRQGETDKSKMRYVYFMDLWKSWVKSFGGDYNIENQTIINGLKNNTLVKGAGRGTTKKITKTGQDKSKLTVNKDFDLDNNQPYNGTF